MRTQTRALFFCLLASVFPACNNYDFAKARKPDGSPDLVKLIADLKAAGKPTLKQGTWIPLIYMNIVTFSASDPNMPEGYSFETFRGYGPLLVAGSTDNLAVDPSGAPIEQNDKEWFGWGALHYDHEEVTQTTSGRRLRHDTRWLLLFGGDNVTYARRAP